jgi:hypothetical protein
MSTVWTFGDSYTESYNPKYIWSNKYINWKGYQPKVHADFIGEILNMDVKNVAVGGTDNYTIFESFCKNVKQIKENDILVFGWSGLHRFRVPNKNKEWFTVLINTLSEEEIKLENIDYSYNTIKEIIINRDHELYMDEVNWWIYMIEHVMKPRRCVFWSPFKPIGKLKVLNFGEIETIKTETNGLINDTHYSENGQKKLAELIIQNLNGKLI